MALNIYLLTLLILVSRSSGIWLIDLAEYPFTVFILGKTHSSRNVLFSESPIVIRQKRNSNCNAPVRAKFIPGALFC